MDGRVNSGNDFSTWHRNLVSIGLVGLIDICIFKVIGFSIVLDNNEGLAYAAQTLGGAHNSVGLRARRPRLQMQL